jgi:hypothetical protein
LATQAEVQLEVQQLGSEAHTCDALSLQPLVSAAPVSHRLWPQQATPPKFLLASLTHCRSHELVQQKLSAAHTLEAQLEHVFTRAPPVW